jgi:hypothetical protein
MKTAILILLQFLLFVAIFAAGMVVAIFDPLQLKWFVTHPTPATTRYFAPDGLLLTLLLYLLILAIEAARKVLRPAGLHTTIALVLALIAGFYFHFGFAG